VIFLVSKGKHNERKQYQKKKELNIPNAQFKKSLHLPSYLCY